MKFSKFLGFSFLLALLLAFGWGFTHAQDIRDWYTLRNYHPPAEIVALADGAALSDEGRRYFYVGEPELNEREAFNEHCNFEEQSIVLGCYSSRRIYIFDITDPRLSGVEEVTAAHEMLHAAYDRLSDKERNEVDAMLETAYATLDDDRVLSLVDSYRKSDPDSLDNELHSILGTEVEDLPAELETYYQQYFTDRAHVVALSNQYESIFVNLESEIKALEEEITALKAQIETDEEELTSLKATLLQEEQNLDDLKSSGDIPGYNAAVPGYNQLVNAYNGKLDSYKSLIETYNQKVAEYNQAATQQNELIHSLDSNFEGL